MELWAFASFAVLILAWVIAPSTPRVRVETTTAEMLTPAEDTLAA